jgi:hypothetical protein
MFNTEAGRAANTANTAFAGGSTPTTGSIIKIYENSGVNQTAPHAFSEMYGITYVASVTQVYIQAVIISNSSIRFFSRNSCGGSGLTTGCQIDINFNYTNDGGTTSDSTSIGAGSNNFLYTLTQNGTLSSVSITSVSWNAGSCSGYALNIC